MTRPFNATDEGSTVYAADGETLGTVETVSESRIHVRPHASLARDIRQTLGWKDETRTYELKHSAVHEIADDGIHLTQSF